MESGDCESLADPVLTALAQGRESVGPILRGRGKGLHAPEAAGSRPRLRLPEAEAYNRHSSG